MERRKFHVRALVKLDVATIDALEGHMKSAYSYAILTHLKNEGSVDAKMQSHLPGSPNGYYATDAGRKRYL